MENKIEIVRGTTNKFKISISGGSGAPYNPQDGDVAIFGVKKNKNDPDLIFVKKATISRDGTAVFLLCPEDTCDLRCDKYHYDVGLESGEDFYNIIPPTEFHISPNITAKGCAAE